jgi:teichuronic acid biosynthesis glycosyltransferase TuaG
MVNIRKDTISVSVIIPCYNCSLVIHRAIESVINQTVSPLEIILVDDQSNDETLGTLYELSLKFKYITIKIIEMKKNEGPGKARNVAWDAAVGKYLAFLDSDDVWESRKLERQYNFMQANEKVNMTGHSSEELRSFKNIPLISDLTIEPWAKISAEELLLKNMFPTRSVMLKSTISHRFATTSFAEDYLLWLSIILTDGEIYFCKSSLAFSFLDTSNTRLSNNFLKMQLGVFSVYRVLYKSSYISYFSFLKLSSFSLIKLPIRYMIFLTKKWGSSL